MTFLRTLLFTFALALLGLPASAGAQAFGLNEIGSCALARGFATTAVPCDDASSIFWNPGALPKTTGFSFYGGAAIIAINGDFTRDTSFTNYKGDVPNSVVPHIFLNYRGAGRLAFGIGAYVPYGLTSQWTDSFPGRFSAKKASLQTIYVQPNIAFQLNDNWSIGGGPIYGHSSVELIQAIDLAPVPTSATGPTFGQLGIAARTEFAQVRLKGSSNAFGVTVGVHGKLTPTWEMGARFLSQLTFKYDNADATFEQRPTGLFLAPQQPVRSAGGYTSRRTSRQSVCRRRSAHRAEGQHQDSPPGAGPGRVRIHRSRADHREPGLRLRWLEIVPEAAGHVRGQCTIEGDPGGLQQHLLDSLRGRASHDERLRSARRACCRVGSRSG